MLQYLGLVASVAERVGNLDLERCSPSASALTFGIAKTDPWGHDFYVTCTPNGRQVSSPGPDGLIGTEDDLHEIEPFVSGEDACAAACARADACASPAAVDCPERCSSIEDFRTHFALDSCAALARCDDANRCFDRALSQLDRPWCRPEGTLDCSPALIDGGCEAFVRIATHLAKAKRADRPKLLEACEDYGTAWVHDLVCLEASQTLEEAARCHLTVYRGWIDPFRKRNAG